MFNVTAAFPSSKQKAAENNSFNDVYFLSTNESRVLKSSSALSLSLSLYGQTFFTGKKSQLLSYDFTSHCPHLSKLLSKQRIIKEIRIEMKRTSKQ